MELAKYKGRLVYLATPYSDPDPDVQELRFLRVNKIAADLMCQGVLVFSPISHTHPIALAGDLPKGWEFWKEFDRKMLSMCAAVIVYMQPGFDRSTGVVAEILAAKKLGIPVEYMAFEG